VGFQPASPGCATWPQPVAAASGQNQRLRRAAARGCWSGFRRPGVPAPRRAALAARCAWRACSIYENGGEEHARGELLAGLAQV